MLWLKDIGQLRGLVRGRFGRSSWGTGGGRATSLFAGCKFNAVGVQLLSGSGQVVGSGFQGAKGGTFSCCRGMGLELLNEKGDQWGVEGASLRCFVGDVRSLGSVQ